MTFIQSNCRYFPRSCFLAFISQRKSIALYKALLDMRRQQNGTYSADSIEDIVDVINYLHKNMKKTSKGVRCWPALLV